MNKQRRKLLTLIEKDISEILSRLENIEESEQEAFDNMPEGIQNSERGEKAQETLDELSSMKDALEEAANLSMSITA